MMKKSYPWILVFTAFAALCFLGHTKTLRGQQPASATKVAEINHEVVNVDFLKHSAWFNIVRKQIEAEEYEIVFDKQKNNYISANRRQNLLFTYYKNGFSVRPYETNAPLFDIADKSINENGKKYKQADNWNVRISLGGYGRDGGMVPFEGKKLCINQRDASIDDSSIEIEYNNSEKGMAQDFVVKSKPAGSGDLKLLLHIRTKLEFDASGLGLAFTKGSSKVEMNYGGMKIHDAAGKEIDGEIVKLNDYTAEICINDDASQYPITIDPLSSTAGWTQTGESTLEGFGVVATAGDVNGDGYSDVIVGASGYSGNTGKVYVYYGSATGLLTTASWTKTGENAGDRFGSSVAMAGDVNGDGYSDIIVGAVGYSSFTGKVYVYNGSPTGLSSTPSWTQTGENAYDRFGWSVATAGDVNKDGYSDVIVGASYYPYPSGYDSGKVYVYYGSSTGLPAKASWTKTGENGYSEFGFCVATAGDVNGDRYSDVVISAAEYSGSKGKVYVYYGGSSGLDSTASWTQIGENNSDGFGYSVASAGDVTGTGYSSIIVGAWEYPGDGHGKAYVYYGGPSGLDSTASWTRTGENADDHFGCSVATAGDVNIIIRLLLNVKSDVIIGAYGYPSGNNTGKAYVYYGSSSGLDTIPAWTQTGENTGDEFGRYVATAGDANGDGYSDVIVGAPGYPSGNDTGKVYVYYGAQDVPLAVQATGFSIKADVASITLSWNTQSEINNAGFNVLREDPGADVFKLISSYSSNDSLRGMGTSTTGKDYNFKDNKVISGKTYNYKIQSVSTTGAATDLKTFSITVDIPTAYSLYQNFPNPFNPSTTIRFNLKQSSTVTLEIYNVLGQRMEYWNYGMMDAGRYDKLVSMSALSSGVYYYRIMAQGTDGRRFVSVKKLVLMK